MSGRQIGRYSIIDTLGEGGMGTVYRAFDSMLDREVAIKVLHLPRGMSQDTLDGAIARFFTEARAAARLAHPCIVTVFDVGDDDGQLYLAMELLDGPTLGEVLSEAGALDIPSAISVLEQIAEGLAHAHSQGVVHRDIKPENCFWLPDGRVKVADFGIARVSSETRRTQAGTILGTPGYMAPEQVRGQDAGPEADVFSWGALAYECLTGQPPFGEDDPQAVMYRIVHEDPPDPRSLRRDVPKPVSDIVMTALQKDPERRYPDATALLSALRGEVSTVRPIRKPRPAPVPAPAQRNGPASSGRGGKIALVAGLTVAVMAIAALVVVLLVVVNRQGKVDLTRGSGDPGTTASASPATPDASPTSPTSAPVVPTEQPTTTEPTTAPVTTAPRLFDPSDRYWGIAIYNRPDDPGDYQFVSAVAQRARTRLAANGYPNVVKVIDSSNFASLGPGHWVAIVPMGRSFGSACSHLAEYKSVLAGIGSANEAYGRYVSRFEGERPLCQ